MLVRGNSDQYGLIRGRHLEEDFTRAGVGVITQIADVDREASLRLPRPVRQRVVERRQLVVGERVVDRQFAGLGNTGEASTDGLGPAARKVSGGLDCDVTTCHLRTLQSP
ncbi:Uncharacterised protein [Mycobacteroides abscessus subsp. abscessus]|nr:Uncharacterised protein [Mycobacteroides abscessus subsp. abscessus]